MAGEVRELRDVRGVLEGRLDGRIREQTEQSECFTRQSELLAATQAELKHASHRSASLALQLRRQRELNKEAHMHLQRMQTAVEMSAEALAQARETAKRVEAEAEAARGQVYYLSLL